MSHTYLDGNIAAGILADVFVSDLTTARGQCTGCREVAVLAEAHVYTDAPGLVIRCGSCEEVLLRVVQGNGRTWMDLRGLAYLQLRTPDQLADS